VAVVSRARDGRTVAEPGDELGRPGFADVRVRRRVSPVIAVIASASSRCGGTVSIRSYFGPSGIGSRGKTPLTSRARLAQPFIAGYGTRAYPLACQGRGTPFLPRGGHGP
jgi:hypothetical protein